MTTPKQSEFWRDLDEKETDRIRQYSQYVKRTGTTLELILTNGKKTKFTDFNEAGREGEWTSHRFVDYLKDIDHFLIRQHYYEGQGYTLVDRKYGSIQKLDAAPVFSQDRKHFITVSTCEAHCPNRLQIWKRYDGGGWFEMVWSYSPYEYWANVNEKWLDNTRIEFTIEATDPATSDPNKGKYNYVKKLKYLKLQLDGWNFIEK